jgi:hypothetical protein
MRPRLTGTALAATVAALAIAATAGAAAIVLKSYSFSTLSDVKNMKHTNGKHCTKSWALHRAFGISVGRDTVECTYRTTVAGPSLDISATGRLLSSTPTAIRGKTFLSVSVRHGSNSEYELAVFPKTKQYKLFRRHTGARDVVQQGQLNRINGVGQRNKLRLRAFAPGSGDPGELKVFINDKRVKGISVTPNFNGMEGQDSTVSVAQRFGASGTIRGAKATFDSIVVRTRNPFG